MKSQKVITLEDVDSSTTVTLSPVVHKQQPKAKNIHSCVQDLYPPPTNPHNSRSSTVTADNNDHQNFKKILPKPSPSCPQNPPEATPVVSVQVQPPHSAVSASSTLQDIQQDVDSAALPVEGRTADAVCMSNEATKDKVIKQQIPSKQRKKRIKTTSPKLVDETSNQDTLELKRPVSDDICNWLQLEESENRELERQQTLSKSCDWSRDLQAVAGINGSQDTEQSTNCQTSLTNNTEECRLSPQRRVAIRMQTPPIVQQQRLSDSETVTDIQSTTCKH